MRPARPSFPHPPETYEAILREHRHEPLLLAARLRDFGWSLADAAWVAVHWPPLWLAAAIAHARTAHDGPPLAPRRKTTRIVRRSPTRPKPPPSESPDSEPPDRA